MQVERPLGKPKVYCEKCRITGPVVGQRQLKCSINTCFPSGRNRANIAVQQKSKKVFAHPSSSSESNSFDFRAAPRARKEMDEELWAVPPCQDTRRDASCNFGIQGIWKTWGVCKDSPKKPKHKPSCAVGMRFPYWQTKAG